MPQGILEEEEEVPKEEEVVVEEIEVEPVVPTEPQENVPPLVLWTSKENPEKKVIVPQIVGKFLRPHQREGVQFMFDCGTYYSLT
jgi:SNF2 family DNA or RNA helicase